MRVTTSLQMPTLTKQRIEEEARRRGTSNTEVILNALDAYFDHQETQDSWETIDMGEDYDPRKVYTYGQDRYGHSVNLRVQVPKPLAGEIARLVQSGEVPEYRVAQHFYRDAIYHRAKQVSIWLDDGKLGKAADLTMLASEEMRMQEERREVETLIGAIEANARWLFDREEWDRLERYLEERRDQAEAIPELFRADYIAPIEDYVKKLRRRKG